MSQIIEIDGQSSWFDIEPPHNLISIDGVYYRVVGRPSEHELEIVEADQ